MAPLVEVKATVKVASLLVGVAVSTVYVSSGSIVNLQPLPAELRVTEVSLAVSTPVASPQVIV